MALKPSDRYPGQTDLDAAYPQGKARNAGSYQDGTGTPLEKDWVNDDWGFKQALLAAASITPSGDPDSATASQYLNAVTTIATNVATPIAALRAACYSFNGAGEPYSFTQIYEHGGFLLEGGNTVRLPSAGTYFAIARASLDFFTSGSGIGIFDMHGTTSVSTGSFRDQSSHTIEGSSTFLVSLMVMRAATISDVAAANSKIRLTSRYAGSSATVSTTRGCLFVLRLG